MWLWTRRIIVGLLGLLTAALCVGATYQWRETRNDLAAASPPGALVDIGGYKLHIWCMGQGSPTVVLETGLGGSAVNWGLVQPEVARFTRVCSYDRAGLGYSDSSPSPRTARQTARELAQLLDRTGISEPVVLTGASSGSFVVRIFASDYGDRTAGLVLVDGSHEDQAHDIPRLAPFVPFLASVGVLRLLGVSFSQPPAYVAPSLRRFARATQFRAASAHAAAGEIMAIRESAAEVRASRRTLTIPLVVITAGVGSDSVWLGLQRDQLRLSQHACHLIATHSGHLIAFSEPEIVVEAIRLVVNAAREQNTMAQCGRNAER